MDEKERKKKLKAGIVAGVTTASVLVGSTFDSPRDIFDDKKTKPEAISEHFENSEPENSSSEKMKNRRFREFVYKIPVRIRAIIFMPLWFIGYGLTALVQLLIKAAMTPVGEIVTGFLLRSLILFGIVGLSIKALFPDLPFRKIFNVRNITAVILGSLSMSVCDHVVPLFWDQYEFYSHIIKLVMGSILLILVISPYIKKKMKNLYSYEIEY